MAMALLQGGSSLNILTQSVINYLCGMKPQDIVVGVNEIADVNVKRILEKVYKCMYSIIIIVYTCFIFTPMHPAMCYWWFSSNRSCQWMTLLHFALLWEITMT